MNWVVMLLCLSVFPNVPLSGQSGGYRHEVLWDFEPRLKYPNSRLLALADGSLLGQTVHGGSWEVGAVFRVDASGKVRVQLSYDGSGPRHPRGGLCAGPDGSLYGASFESPSGYGALFRITTQGQVEMLHQFDPSQGIKPHGDLVLTTDGSLFGTCVEGGAFGTGTVFKWSPVSGLTVIKSFSSGGDQGAIPMEGLVDGGDGWFYGTALVGGAEDRGTLFRVNAAGAFEKLLSFTAALGGYYPRGPLLVDEGWLYGTTSSGTGSGGTTADEGIVFRYQPGTATFEQLLAFGEAGMPGASPYGGLCRGPDGAFYGTTLFTQALSGYGIIYRLTSGTWQLTQVAEFTGNSGALPGDNGTATLTLAGDGKLYGVSYEGGRYQSGTVFRVHPGESATAESIHAFGGGPRNPQGELVVDDDGSFLGVSAHGGGIDAGTLFRWTVADGVAVLHDFNTTSGWEPRSGLTRGPENHWYGTTVNGGGGYGSLYRLKAGVVEVLHGADGTAEGPKNFYGGLCLAPDGALYGMSYGGGNQSIGVVYRWSPAAGFERLTDLTFNSGGAPFGRFAVGADGELYAVTYQGGSHGGGTLLRYTLGGSLEVLNHFVPTSTIGGYPNGSLLATADGNLYGTTSYSSTYWRPGSLFRYKIGQGMQVSYGFASIDLGYPSGSLVQAPDGVILGNADSFGSGGHGGIFQFRPDTLSFSQVQGFTGDAGEHRGASPQLNGMVVGPDGFLYGLTNQGGRFGLGTIYRLKPPDADLEVASEAGDVQTSGSGLDFGPAVVSTGSVREWRLKVRNTGGLPLETLNLELSGTGKAAFALVDPPSPPLAPGAEVDLVIRFAPATLGRLEALLTVTSDDPDEPTFELNLFGDGAGDPAKVYRQPVSRLLRTGDNVAQFDVTVAGNPPPTTAWFKNGRAIRGATGTRLRITPLSTTHAGKYTAVTSNATGQKDTSEEAWLGVLVRAPLAPQVGRGRSITLVCTAAMPPGVTAEYQWTKDGVDLPGADSALLTIDRADPALHNGEYDCRVTMPTPGGGNLVLTHGAANLSVVDQPVISTTALGNYTVGQHIMLWLSASGLPLQWTAKGLPAGVTLNPTTGQLSGRPQVARVVNGAVAPYHVQLTATNAAGVSRTVVVTLTVQPLPWAMVGDYEGLLDLRDHPVSEKLGGFLKAKLSATGAVSGSLVFARRTLAFRGQFDWDSLSMTTEVNAGVPVGVLPLVLSFRDTTGNAWVRATLGSGASYHDGRAYRSYWDGGNVATAYEATYNARLRPGLASLSGPPSAAPHGDGFLQSKMAASGRVSWSGRLPEGTAMLGAAKVNAQGRVPVLHWLYGKTGSVAGWLQLAPWSAGMTGGLDWVKKPQAPAKRDRSYAGGFEMLAQEQLSVSGGRYTPPPRVDLPSLLPSLAAGPDNAELIFSSGGLPATVTRLMEIKPDHSVLLPVQLPANRITLKVNATTGLFSGVMTHEDGSPAVQRTASYQGLIIPGSGGAGYFLLPSLPDPSGVPPTTLTNSPIYSGRVQWLAVDR